jgi:signal transduction histidine kinase
VTRGRPPTSTAVTERDIADRAPQDLVWLRSHDLTDALSSIVGSAELIDSGDLTDDQRRLLAGTLLRKAGRLNALVNNAVALQRLETGHRELDLAPVDLRSLIDLEPGEISALQAKGAIAVLPKEAGAPQAAVTLIADTLAIDEVAG